MYETALSKGYNIMHPNCRHEFVPFIEEMYSEEELKRIIADSNHFEEFNTKDERLFKIYNRDQALQRQWIQEHREYDEMREILGNRMPYKTLGGFRRASRAKSDEYNIEKNRVFNYKRAENDKEIVDFYKKSGYTDILFRSKLKDLQRQYFEKVEQKTLEDVGFYKFAKTFVRASNELIGEKTSDGRLIKGITVHLPERIIGDGTKAHLPIPLEKVKEALFNGKVEDSHEDSVTYTKDGVRVSFSIIKNYPIQCNYSD